MSVQNPLVLGEHFDPEPDLVLERRREGRAGVPIPEEVLLVVEVAATSLICDRETKLPLYAEASIPEAWLVDLTTDMIEAYSEPGQEGYGKLVCFGRGERVLSAALSDLTLTPQRPCHPRVRRTL